MTPPLPPTTTPTHTLGRDRAKHHARDEFENWARTYDRSLLNELVFFPSIRACQIEIADWCNTRHDPAAAYRALDVGCGTGRLLSILARDPRAERLIGLDYSRAMIASLTEKVRRFGFQHRLHPLLGDSERLPLADAALDVVTCCNSFHHYPHQAQAVQEFHRVLRPGGLLILIDGFRDNVIGWIVFDVAVASFEKQVHHCPWSEIDSMIRNAGFTDVRQRKMNVLAPLLVTTARRA